MQTKIDEIGADMYRLSIFVPEVAPPAGITFNHFLITGDEPLLFHCGKRMVPLVSAAVARIIPLKRLPCSPPSCRLRRAAKVAAWRHIVPMDVCGLRSMQNTSTRCSAPGAHR
jgi:hypothetical protein